MSVQKLLAALKKEADLQEKTILTEADEKAGAIISSARDKVAEIQSLISKLEKEHSVKAESVRLAREKMLARKKAILTLNQIISDVFSECSRMFSDFMKTPAYASFLKEEYNKIAGEFGTIDEIRADPKTGSVLKELNINNVSSDDNIQHGFMALAENKKTKILCLFDLRLKKLWTQKAPWFVNRISQAMKNND